MAEMQGRLAARIETAPRLGRAGSFSSFVAGCTLLLGFAVGRGVCSGGRAGATSGCAVTAALVAILAASYAVGSIPSGFFAPDSATSTSVTRAAATSERPTSHGRRAAGLGLLTLWSLDAAKGAAPVLVADALHLFPDANPAFDRNAAIAAALGARARTRLPDHAGLSRRQRASRRRWARS